MERSRGREIARGDTRLLVGGLLLTKQWKLESCFLEQRLWGCSCIRSGLGVAGDGVAAISEVGEPVGKLCCVIRQEVTIVYNKV